MTRFCRGIQGVNEIEWIKVRETELLKHRRNMQNSTITKDWVTFIMSLATTPTKKNKNKQEC